MKKKIYDKPPQTEEEITEQVDLMAQMHAYKNNTTKEDIYSDVYLCYLDAVRLFKPEKNYKWWSWFYAKTGFGLIDFKRTRTKIRQKQKYEIFEYQLCMEGVSDEDYKMDQNSIFVNEITPEKLATDKDLYNTVYYMVIDRIIYIINESTYYKKMANVLGYEASEECKVG